MPAIQSALVIGAGVAGGAAAVLLAELGIDVTVVEAKPVVPLHGSGITLQGNALRVLRRLGVWDAVAAAGYPFNTLGLRAPDPDGSLIVELDDIRTGGPDLPATLGMSRPDLARILTERATAAGATFRFGTTPTGLDQDGTGVDVTLSDGTQGRYDLVIGADGVRSWTRGAIGIDLRSTPLGMGIWRISTSRPPGVTRTDLYYGGPCYIAGYCPTGEDSLYAYLVEDYTDRSELSAEAKLATMTELARAYHGPWDDIRERMTDASRVNYTWFESHVLPAPWNRGRVVLIGDAAHTCPPTMAQGAAQALEDALVLAELVGGHDRLDEALWSQFTARRYERAKAVVDGSVQLSRWQLEHNRDADVPGLIGRISTMVTDPA
jgi:2-polyprenyl-6-methoxyphenol hydroxylase-like FAD-dependent oxidoreductase